jgi:hypothetical protein
MITATVNAAMVPKSTLRYGFHTEEDVSAKAKALAATSGFMVGMAEQTLAFKCFLSLATKPELTAPVVWLLGNWVVTAGLSFMLKEAKEQRISKLHDSNKKPFAAKIVADYLYRQGRIPLLEIPQVEAAYIQARNGAAVKDGDTLRACHNKLLQNAVLSAFFWRGCAAATLGGPVTGIVGCYVLHHTGILDAPLKF